MQSVSRVGLVASIVIVAGCASPDGARPIAGMLRAFLEKAGTRVLTDCVQTPPAG